MFNLIKWFYSFFKDKKIEKPKKQTLKKHYITRHGQKRFEERHGIVFTNKMAKCIIEKIVSKNSKFIKKTSSGSEEWISKCDNKKYKVIFDPVDKIIITVYPGVKKKSRKPSRRKKIRNIHGRKIEIRSSCNHYKRNKKVEYGEVV